MGRRNQQVFDQRGKHPGRIRAAALFRDHLNAGKRDGADAA
jgi:hypothetical protein